MTGERVANWRIVSTPRIGGDALLQSREFRVDNVGRRHARARLQQGLCYRGAERAGSAGD